MSNWDDEDGYQLSLKMDNSRNVLQLLKAVNFENEATFFASSKGLKVTVEVAKCVQANAFIESEIFQEYYVGEDIVTFKISLKSLVDCLSIFGNSSSQGVTPSLKLFYGGYGTPLEIILEEGGALTDCKIRTRDCDDTLDFNFTSTGVVNKIIMRSEILKEIFSELDSSSEVLELYMAPDPPYFRLSTFGSYGANTMDIPRTSEMVETFDVKQTMTQRYKLSLLKHCNKALGASQKVSVRTDNRGFLCLQFMIKTEDSHICFVEFFCCPDEDGDD